MSATAASSASTSDIASVIQQFASQFANVGSAMLGSVDNAAVQIAKSAVVALIVLGVILYFTHVSKRLGKEFVEGGIILGFFTVFGVPFLMSLHL
jgi:hypothetical protein